MFLEYIEAAIKKAEYKKLEDNSWYGELPGFNGVWANCTTVEECRNELIEVLEEWLLLKIKESDPIPTIDNLNISIRQETV